MIVYEMQLRYEIETKFNPRQNPVWDKIQSEKNPKKYFLSEKKFVRKKFFVGKKNFSLTLSQISSVQSELSRTNQWLPSLSGKYIPQ